MLGFAPGWSSKSEKESRPKESEVRDVFKTAETSVGHYPWRIPANSISPLMEPEQRYQDLSSPALRASIHAHPRTRLV